MPKPSIPSRARVDSAAAVLWASAFVVAALVIVQAGRLPGNPAYADQSVELGGYTLLTTGSGTGRGEDPNELLYVLDSRDDTLLVYEVPDARQKQINLLGGASLPAWFQNARR
jgi:hypothetical protein